MMKNAGLSPWTRFTDRVLSGMIRRVPHLTDMVRVRRQFQVNAGLSRDQLCKANLMKFRELVAYAQQHSPYYGAIIREHGIDPHTCVPQDFPVLTKADYITHFDDIVTDRTVTGRKVSAFLGRSTDPADLFDGRYHVVHTSGTSGTVGYYLYSPAEWLCGSLHFAKTQTLGWRRRLAYVGAAGGHFTGAALADSAGRGLLKLLYRVRVFDINSPTEQVIEGLNAFQPAVVSGYGGSLKILARYRESGRLNIRPQQLYYSGEPLAPEDRRHVQAVFDAPCVNLYICSEHLMMGMTEPGADRMRLFEDDLIFEFQPDHVRVTNLYNRTVPLIRYRLDDVLTPVPSSGDGHPFTRVRDLVGRSEKMLVFKNRHGQRDFIHPIVIAEFYVPGLRAFQVVATGQTSFTFRAQLDRGLDDVQRDQTLGGIHRRLGGLLAQKHMENVCFDIQPVESLRPDPHTGKFNLIRFEVDLNKDPSGVCKRVD